MNNDVLFKIIYLVCENNVIFTQITPFYQV